MTQSGWRELRRLRGHERLISQFHWSPRGTDIASVGQDGRLVIWDVATGKPSIVRDLRRPVAAVAWSPDGDVLAVAVYDDHTASQLLDIDELGYSDEELEDENELLARFERGDFGPLQIETQDEGLAYAWLLDAESGLSLGNLATPSVRSAPEDVVWRDSSILFTASEDGICQWQARDGHFLGFLEDGDEAIHGVAVHEDGHLTAACGERLLAIWDTDGHIRASAEVDDLHCITFAPGRDLVATAVGKSGKSGNPKAGRSGSAELLLPVVPGSGGTGDPVSVELQDVVCRSD